MALVLDSLKPSKRGLLVKNARIHQHHRGVFGQVLNVFGHRFSGLRRWGRPGWIEAVRGMEGNVHQLPVDHPRWAAGGAAGCLMVGEG